MIQVGDTVRVLSNVKGQRGQTVKVLSFEPDSYHRRETGDWYLLDTVEPKYKWSYPCFYKASEIEKVEAAS